MGMTPVFFVEMTDQYRFHWQWWCEDCKRSERVEKGRGLLSDGPGYPSPAPERIPCSTCGRPIQFSSSGSSPIYRRSGGEEIADDKLPPGACYASPDGAFVRNAPGYHRFGPDGRALTVVCPNGMHWEIDGRASNCTMPDDPEHYCWVRHGRPEDGTLHVDKNGKTCGAGAGSIQMGGYHGFLHNGQLTAA